MAELTEKQLIHGAVTNVLITSPAVTPDGFGGQANRILKVLEPYFVERNEYDTAIRYIEKLEGVISDLKENARHENWEREEREPYIG